MARPKDQRCLFCGGDASERNHRARCDGRQGRAEAAQAEAAAILGPDYRPPFAAGRPTSEAAARAIAPRVGSVAAKILTAVDASATGVTCDEIEVLYGMKHQTASAAIWALHRKRRALRDSGIRRPTRSGEAAIAWVRT